MNMLEEGLHQHNIAQKRTKFEEITEKKGGEDRISSLPDCLLLEILSRLRSTKKAIRTGTLSKRWAQLWTLVPTLTLVGCKLNPIGAISWKNLRSLRICYLYLDEDVIVNILSGSPLLETLFLQYCCGYTWRHNVTSETESESEAEADPIQVINARNNFSLSQCPQLNLNKFEVDTRYDVESELQLNSWIRYVIRCNVKEFTLRFWNTDSEFEFPVDQIVFTASCFTRLELNGCMVNPVGVINWKNLKSLCITTGSLDEDLMENILSGSPVLEHLELDDCYGYKRLDITSKSVKELVLSGYCNYCDDSDSDVIEINAPYILSIAIQMNIYLSKLLLVNVSSLVEAELNYWCTKNVTMPKLEGEILKGYIMNLGHVKELKIGALCSKAVSSLRAQGFIFPSNVKFHGVINDDSK